MSIDFESGQIMIHTSVEDEMKLSCHDGEMPTE